jgi:pimeloyl-ACP methyl ester carboxylesterase
VPFINVDGVKLHYREAGAGYPIIFVHELAGDSREWEQQFAFFARRYRCIAYDARGYLPSDVPSSKSHYGYEYAISDIAGLMEGLGLSKAHIVGLSMGAYATLCFGLRHPEKASALVVAGVGSGSPRASHAAFKTEHQAMAARIRESSPPSMDSFVELVQGMPTRVGLRTKDPDGWQRFLEHLRGHDPAGMANTIEMYQGMRPSLEDFEPELKRLAVPTFLVVGDQDAPCLETNVFLLRTVPGARLMVLPKTGHCVNLEEPATFNAQVLEFFADLEHGQATGQ